MENLVLELVSALTDCEMRQQRTAAAKSGTRSDANTEIGTVQGTPTDARAPSPETV